MHYCDWHLKSELPKKNSRETPGRMAVGGRYPRVGMKPVSASSSSSNEIVLAEVDKHDKQTT